MEADGIVKTSFPKRQSKVYIVSDQESLRLPDAQSQKREFRSDQ